MCLAFGLVDFAKCFGVIMRFQHSITHMLMNRDNAGTLRKVDCNSPRHRVWFFFLPICFDLPDRSQTFCLILLPGHRQLFKILNLNEDIAKTVARKNDGLKEKSDKYHKNLEYMKKVRAYRRYTRKSGRAFMCVPIVCSHYL